MRVKILSRLLEIEGIKPSVGFGSIATALALYGHNFAGMIYGALPAEAQGLGSADVAGGASVFAMSSAAAWGWRKCTAIANGLNK